ncbi:vitamin-D-receptor interacting mediator subunit 4-domain-containing protein [Syncephalis fuscata]|nr:vitamin-D-receptor interacting mediator subunit 4-domain-containing protein [Syncephalis fuscata]
MTSLHTVSQRIDEYASLTRKLFSTLEALADDKRAAAGLEEPRLLLSVLLHWTLEEHQQWQQQILDTETAIDGCDRAAERLVRTLHRAKMTLEDAVDEAEEQIEAAAIRTPLDPKQVLAYAKRLAPYTSAPPKFDPAQPAQAFEKPFPDEQMMRAGRLGQLETDPEVEASGHGMIYAEHGPSSGQATDAHPSLSAIGQPTATTQHYEASHLDRSTTTMSHEDMEDDLLDLDLNPDLS